MVTFEKLYFLSILLCILFGLFLAIVLPYSSFLYRKLNEIEPEFFKEKNFCYYITKLNSTQFIFYILFNQDKKIKDPVIRKRCRLIKIFLYFFFLLLHRCHYWHDWEFYL